MITVKLGAGLGNNLFQYVTSRTLAASKGYRFCYFPVRGYTYYKKRLLTELNRLLRRRPKEKQKQIVQADLSEYFTLDRSARLRQYGLRLLWMLVPGTRKSVFSPIRKAYSADRSFEIMDQRLFQVSDWTLLQGGFQSLGYFAGNRAQILDWLTLRPRYKRQLDRILARIPVPEQQRCCVHVRRGDYLETDKGLAFEGQGLALPFEYYTHAIALLPDDLLFVFSTDSPDYVHQNFEFVKNKLVLTGNSESVDIWMFAHCKYNIIANSTFSWWGAWLNDIESKIVIAPKYNIGWARKLWLPWGFEYHPDDWHYVDVLGLVEGQDA